MSVEMLPMIGDFNEIPLELASKNEEPRWCPDCGGVQTFYELYRCEVGRVGICFGCEQEKLILWERSNSEAA